MSIGAINQLIINNERPDIFTNNPSITFFKPNYRKYVNFAKTEQQYQLPNISFGSSVEFNLPKTDYINNIILSVLLPEISGKFKRWTKRQVKKKLEEYGFIWETDNLDNQMTDQDFIELIGEIIKEGNKLIRKPEEGGLINQYIQDLRDQKELLTKYLQSIANVIKNFLDSMQFQQLNDLFNITYSCEQYTDLINKIDYDFKSTIGTIGNGDIIDINREILLNDYQFGAEEDIFNQFLEPTIRTFTNLSQHTQDIIIEDLKDFSFKDINTTNELNQKLYQSVYKSLLKSDDNIVIDTNAKLITNKLIQTIDAETIRKDLLNYDKDNEDWQLFVKNLIFTFDANYVDSSTLFFYISNYYYNITKDKDQARTNSLEALKNVSNCLIKRALISIDELLGAICIYGICNLLDLFNLLVSFYSNKLVDIGKYQYVVKESMSESEARNKTYSIFKQLRINLKDNISFYPYYALEYELETINNTGDIKDIQLMIDTNTELINSNYDKLYQYSNLFYANFQNAINSYFSIANGYINYQLIIEYINGQITNDIFDFLNLEIEYYNVFNDILLKLANKSGDYQLVYDAIKDVDIDYGGKTSNDFIEDFNIEIYIKIQDLLIASFIVSNNVLSSDTINKIKDIKTQEDIQLILFTDGKLNEEFNGIYAGLISYYPPETITSLIITRLISIITSITTLLNDQFQQQLNNLFTQLNNSISYLSYFPQTQDNTDEPIYAYYVKLYEYFNSLLSSFNIHQIINDSNIYDFIYTVKYQLLVETDENINNKIAFDSIIQTTTGFNIIKNNNIVYQLNTTTKTLSSNTKTYYYTNYESKDNVITLTIYNDIIYIDTQYNKILFYSDIINYSSIALKNLLIYCVNTFYILLKPLNDIMQTTISKLLSNPNTNRTFNIYDIDIFKYIDSINECNNYYLNNHLIFYLNKTTKIFNYNGIKICSNYQSNKTDNGTIITFDNAESNITYTYTITDTLTNITKYNYTRKEEQGDNIIYYDKDIEYDLIIATSTITLKSYQTVDNEGIIEKVNEQLILTATIKKSTDDYYVAISNEIEYHIYHNSDPLLIYHYRRLIEKSNVNKVKYSSDKIITNSDQLNNCSFTTYTNNDTLNNTLTIAIVDDNINLHRIFIYYANDGYVFNFTKESDGLTYSDVDNLYQLVINTNNIVLYELHKKIDNEEIIKIEIINFTFTTKTQKQNTNLINIYTGSNDFIIWINDKLTCFIDSEVIFEDQNYQIINNEYYTETINNQYYKITDNTEFIRSYQILNIYYDNVTYESTFNIGDNIYCSIITDESNNKSFKLNDNIISLLSYEETNTKISLSYQISDANYQVIYDKSTQLMEFTNQQNINYNDYDIITFNLKLTSNDQITNQLTINKITKQITFDNIITDYITLTINNQQINIIYGCEVINIDGNILTTTTNNYLHYDSITIKRSSNNITFLSVASYSMNMTFNITTELLTTSDNLKVYNANVDFHGVIMKGIMNEIIEEGKLNKYVFISSIDNTNIVIDENNQSVEIVIKKSIMNSFNHNVCLDNMLIFIQTNANVLHKLEFFKYIQVCRNISNMIIGMNLPKSIRLLNDFNWLVNTNSSTIAQKAYTNIHYSITQMIAYNYKTTNISKIITYYNDTETYNEEYENIKPYFNDFINDLYKELNNNQTNNITYPYLFYYYVQNYLITNNQIDNTKFYNEYVRLTYQIYKLYCMNLIDKIRNVTSYDLFALIKLGIENYDGIDIIGYAKEIMESVGISADIDSFIKQIFSLLNTTEYFEFYVQIIKNLFNVVSDDDNLNIVMMYLLNFTKDETNISKYKPLKDVINIGSFNQSNINIFNKSELFNKYQQFILSNRFAIKNTKDLVNKEYNNGEYSFYRNYLIQKDILTDKYLLTNPSFNIYNQHINSIHYNDLLTRYKLTDENVICVDSELKIGSYTNFYELSEFYDFKFNELQEPLNDQLKTISYLVDNNSDTVISLEVIPTIQTQINRYYIDVDSILIIPTLILSSDENVEIYARNLYLYYYTILCDFDSNNTDPIFYIVIKQNNKITSIYQTIDIKQHPENNNFAVKIFPVENNIANYFCAYDISINNTNIINSKDSLNGVHPHIVYSTPLLSDNQNEYYFKVTIEDNDLIFTKDFIKLNLLFKGYLFNSSIQVEICIFDHNKNSIVDTRDFVIPIELYRYTINTTYYSIYQVPIDYDIDYYAKVTIDNQLVDGKYAISSVTLDYQTETESVYDKILSVTKNITEINDTINITFTCQNAIINSLTNYWYLRSNQISYYLYYINTTNNELDTLPLKSNNLMNYYKINYSAKYINKYFFVNFNNHQKYYQYEDNELKPLTDRLDTKRDNYYQYIVLDFDFNKPQSEYVNPYNYLSNYQSSIDTYHVNTTYYMIDYITYLLTLRFYNDLKNDIFNNPELINVLHVPIIYYPNPNGTFIDQYMILTNSLLLLDEDIEDDNLQNNKMILKVMEYSNVMNHVYYQSNSDNQTCICYSLIEKEPTENNKTYLKFIDNNDPLFTNCILYFKMKTDINDKFLYCFNNTEGNIFKIISLVKINDNQIELEYDSIDNYTKINSEIYDISKHDITNTLQTAIMYDVSDKIKECLPIYEEVIIEEGNNIMRVIYPIYYSNGFDDSKYTTAMKNYGYCYYFIDLSVQYPSDEVELRDPNVNTTNYTKINVPKIDYSVYQNKLICFSSNERTIIEGVLNPYYFLIGNMSSNQLVKISVFVNDVLRDNIYEIINSRDQELVYHYYPKKKIDNYYLVNTSQIVLIDNYTSNYDKYELFNKSVYSIALDTRALKNHNSFFGNMIFLVSNGYKNYYINKEIIKIEVNQESDTSLREYAYVNYDYLNQDDKMKYNINYCCINSNNLPLELEDGLENLSYIIDYIYKYRNDGFNGMFYVIDKQEDNNKNGIFIIESSDESDTSSFDKAYIKLHDVQYSIDINVLNNLLFYSSQGTVLSQVTVENNNAYINNVITDKKYMLVVNKYSSSYGSVFIKNTNWDKITDKFNLWFLDDYQITMLLNERNELVNSFTNEVQNVNDGDIVMVNNENVFDVKVVDKSDVINLKNEVYLQTNKTINNDLNRKFLNIISNDSSFKQYIVVSAFANNIYEFIPQLTIYDYIKTIYTNTTSETFDITSNFANYLRSNYLIYYDTERKLKVYLELIKSDYYNYLTSTYITDITIFKNLTNNIHYVNDKQYEYVFVLNQFEENINLSNSSSNYYNVNISNEVNYEIVKSLVNPNLSSIDSSTSLSKSQIKTDLFNQIANNQIDNVMSELLNKTNIIKRTINYDNQQLEVIIDNANVFYDLFYSRFIKEYFNSNKIILTTFLSDLLTSTNEVHYFIPDCITRLCYYYNNTKTLQVNRNKFVINQTLAILAVNIEISELQGLFRSLFDSIISSCNITNDFNVTSPLDYSIVLKHFNTYNYQPIKFNHQLKYKNNDKDIIVDVSLSKEKYFIYHNKDVIDLLVNAMYFEIQRLFNGKLMIVNNNLNINDKILEIIKSFNDLLLSNDLSTNINYDISETEINDAFYHLVYVNTLDKFMYFTASNTALTKDKFYQFYYSYDSNGDIIDDNTFKFYDYLVTMNNYLLINFHKAFNNQFGALLDNNYQEFQNPLKECKDYITNYNVINDINNNGESYVDYYVNSEIINDHLIPYTDNILDKTINSYNLFYLYKDTFNYYQSTSKFNQYEKNTNIYYAMYDYFYDSIISDVVMPFDNTIISGSKFESILRSNNLSEYQINSIMNFKYTDEGLANTSDEATIEYKKNQIINFKGEYFGMKETQYNLQRKILQLFMFHRLYYDVLNPLNNQILPLLTNINYDKNYLNIFDIFNYNKETRDNELINKNENNKGINDNKYEFLSDIIKLIFGTKNNVNTDYYNADNFIKSAIDFLLTDSLDKTNLTNYDNLINWFNEYVYSDSSDYQKDSKDKIIRILDKIYGLTTESNNLKLSPNILYRKYNDIIIIYFNSLKTEADLIRFLIYFLIDNSLFKYLNKFFTNNNDNYELYNDIYDYFKEQLDEINKKLDQIGYQDNELPNYSKCEEFLRELQNKHLNNLSYYSWNEEIGLYLINKVEFIIGDQLIDTLTSDMLHIYYKLFTSEDKKIAMDKMIGNIKTLTNYDNKLKPKYQLFIPLYYFFNRYVQSSIPMLSLINSNAKLKFYFNTFDYLILKDPDTVLFDHKNITNGFLIIDKINISNKERIIENGKLFRMLIDQHQYYKSIVNLSKIKSNPLIKLTNAEKIKQRDNEESLSNKETNKDTKALSDKKIIKVSNRWYGNSKEMFILLRVKGNRLNDYLVNGNDIIKSIQIKYNEQIRQQTEDIKYYSLINKLNHTSNDQDGIYIYSFSLFPEDIQPSGTANMALIGEVEIEMEIDNEVISDNTILEVIWINKNINFLNFVGGQCGLMYQNVDLS